MRAFVTVAAIAGCAGSQPPVPEQHPIANRASPAAMDPSPCEDVIQGQLYAPVLQIKLTVESVAVRTMREHQSDWFHCYNERIHREPSVEGRVEISFVVEKSGKAGHIRTVGFDAQVDRCICDRVRAIEFDKGVAGKQITYPVHFHSGR